MSATAYTNENTPITIDTLDGGLLLPFYSLYSVNQTNPSTMTTTALTTLGATNTIGSNGRIIYDPTNSTLIQSLVAGQTATDTFAYDLRQSNGTDIAVTESIDVTGVNDVRVISSAPVTLSLAEQAGVTNSACWTSRARPSRSTTSTWATPIR